MKQQNFFRFIFDLFFCAVLAFAATAYRLARCGVSRLASKNKYNLFSEKVLPFQSHYLTFVSESSQKQKGC